MLPTFLCLGAQKCGTTSLWHLLHAHPDVCLARPRETRFFSEPTQFAEGAGAYERRHFAHWKGEMAVGEKCPEYLAAPEAAQRIHDTLGPDIRLIVSLRNPAHRAFSHYRHNRAQLRECRSFDDAIDAEIRAAERGDPVPLAYAYLGRGRYAAQLSPYLRMFPRERFLLLHFESDIATDQRRLASTVFAFLGVPPFAPKGLPFRAGRPRADAYRCTVEQGHADPSRHYVEFVGPRRPGLRGALTGVSRERVYGPSDALRHFVMEYERTRHHDEHLSPDRAVALNQQHFRSDILALQSLTSFDLTAWLGPTVGQVTR